MADSASPQLATGASKRLPRIAFERLGTTNIPLFLLELIFLASAGKWLGAEAVADCRSLPGAEDHASWLP